MNLVNEKLETELSRDKDASVINIVNTLIEYAYSVRASDIHIDPKEHSLRVRMRIDGSLFDSSSLPKSLHSEIISRIKILAKLRTDEQFSAQDGRFRYTIQRENIPVDIRISIIPTHHGENCVLRLLRNNERPATLEDLGFGEADQKKIVRAIQKTSGMILVTGPTGSGKTTTLYTLLSLINSEHVSVVTIEDPIEYSIEDIEQIQVNNKTGITFANGLRSVLRQDPNVIMVGEIRDSETAGIAINSALTGHLLLSTLHTNDAVTTLPRLLDMHIEPYLVASTVSIIIGQRLVRKICEGCKKIVPFSHSTKETLLEYSVSKSHPFLKLKSLSCGMGCELCNQCGYKGRIALYEILVMDTHMRDSVLLKHSARQLKESAQHSGMTPLLYDGLKKVGEGLTTIDEVIRVIHE